MIIEQYGEASVIQRFMKAFKARSGFVTVGVTKRFRKENAWMYE